MDRLGQGEYTWQLNMLAVIVVILIVLFLIRLIYKGKKENTKFPIEKLPAVLLSIEATASGNAMIGRRSRNQDLGMPHERKMAKFQFENGDTIELTVNEDMISYKMIGKKGILEYQGAKLISFRAENSG